MATHSSILAWRIPWPENPGGLQSMGLQGSDLTWQLSNIQKCCICQRGQQQCFPSLGFPGGASAKESACQCGRCRFDLWVGKIPWSRKWQSTLVFSPGESHEQRSLMGYSPRGHKKSSMTEQLCMHACPKYCMGLTKIFFIVYLNFKFNWGSCVSIC